MIKHVNLMQNPIDMTWDKDSEWTKEHIIQALANLGQRVGIKGDSIAYKSFTFNDILSDVYSADNYIGFIEYFRDDELNTYKAKFGVTDKYNLYNSNKEIIIDISQSVNNALIFPNDLSFTIPVNNIEKYSKNSICINENNELTFMLAGKINNDKPDNTNYNTELYYYKFDILTNKLKTGYKLFHFDKEYGDYYCLTNITNNLNNGQLSNSYTLKIKVFNLNEIFDNDHSWLKTSFSKLFNFSNYNISSNVPFTIISEKYKDLNNLLSYSSDYDVNYDSNSAISVILNNMYSSKYKTKEISLEFDSYKNELLSIDDDLLEQTLHYFIQEFNINLYEELYMINEDINKLYINIFKYYNEKFYLEYKSTFIKRILYKIYERSTEFNYEISHRLYIPLDYKFHYICNSNDDLNIYYSNNIYVTYTSLANTELESFWKLNTNIIYDYNGIDKVKVYNFEVTYNKINDELINAIDIKDIYTMPYINANNNWSVNNIDTKIRAIGRDAGNPNIIIILNKNHNDYDILNAVSNKNILESVDYERQWFKINPALFENVNDTNIRCCAFIPKINSSLYEYFKDSLILSVSTLDCFEYDLYKTNYKGSYVYTFWHIVESNGNIKFDLINDTDTSYALSIGSTINLLNAYNDGSVSNLNDQDIILLKSIITNVSQESLSVSNNNWIVMKNKQSEEYVNEYGLKTSDYNNDLNISLQYNDNVNLVSNYVVTSQNSKYINTLNELQITNSLYPKYNVSTITEAITSNEQIKSISKQDMIVASRNSRIFVNNNEITNVEELYESLQKINTESDEFKSITIKREIKNQSNTNYNEYIFNSNVPTIDYKELFVRNANILNRVNIISLDSNGKIYNAYIGTSYDSVNKNVLHIGSTNTNINIGTNTLINETDINKFNIHDTLSIDFKNIILNAQSTLSTNSLIINTYEFNSIKYNCCEFDLIGPFIENTSVNINYYNYLFIGTSISLRYLFNKINIDLNNYEPNIDIKLNTNLNKLTTYKNDNLMIDNINSVLVSDNNGLYIKYAPFKMNILYYIIDEKLYIVITLK